MTVSLKHHFSSAILDDAAATAAGEVLPSHWNAEHDLTGTANRLLGFGGTGVGAEVSMGTGMSLSGGSLSSTITPAGSSLTLQYNNAGSFGGMSGTSWDDTNRSLTLTGATITTNKPIANLSQTWNSGGVAFTAFKVNVTNTASAGSSLLQDLQQDSVSIWSVGSVAGPVTGLRLVPGAATTCTLQILQASLQGICTLVIQPNTSNAPDTYVTVANKGASNAFQIYVPDDSSQGVSFDSGNGNHPLSFIGSTQVLGPTGGIIEQRSGTTAQTFRCYNTFTNSSNYERGVFDWQGSSNLLSVGTEKAGTGSTRNLRVLIGGTSKLDYGVTTAAFWTTPDDLKVRLLQTTGYTVATLPTAGTAGRRAYVTDALAPTFLGTLTGGGGIVTPVFDNGTAWVSE